MPPPKNLPHPMMQKRLNQSEPTTLLSYHFGRDPSTKHVACAVELCVHYDDGSSETRMIDVPFDELHKDDTHKLANTLASRLHDFIRIKENLWPDDHPLRQK